MSQIVECVPNFSEGRRPHVIQAIVDAARGTPGLSVLDVSSDWDHNRTVLTMAGPPAAVVDGAFQAIATAARLIDLHQHTGVHPRIGATDVCPFVPVQGISMTECVGLARSLGQRVGSELGMAVYLYGHAATRPERVRLAQIRQGEFEGWSAAVGTDPGRQPDFGPSVPAPWGATVIGARPFLIAYNLFLNTSDLLIARRIARTIRQSSGGLPHVQARGFMVAGQAQVSMNLTDFTQTPLHQVQELVKQEAAKWGVAVTQAELIGLIPQQALVDAARWYLQLTEMADDQILETRLGSRLSCGNLSSTASLGTMTL